MVLSKSEKSKDYIQKAAEVVAKTLLSEIPFGGALITAVWDSVKSHCAEKRLNNWKQLMEERLARLDITLEDIGNNENFTSAMFAATQSAIKTAEQEKREYLANAVLNAAKCDLQESIIMIFFGLADQYTLWHIKILDFLDCPKNHPNISVSRYMMGSPKQPLFDTYPELKRNEPLTDKIIKDLFNDGLISTNNFDCMMTAQGMLESRTTELGKQFIEFLRE